VLLDYHLAAGLHATEDLLADRGISLGFQWPGAPDTGGDGLAERLAGKMRAGLLEHCPGLGSALDEWIRLWESFCGQRDELVQQASRLLMHKGYEGELADRLARIGVHQVLEMALEDRDAYRFEVKDSGAATEALVAESERSTQVLRSGTSADLNIARKVLQDTMEQVRLRLEPAPATYREIKGAAVRVQSLVDDLLLRGRPPGSCFLCPYSTHEFTGAVAPVGRAPRSR
jgi:hypothetical protein